MRGRPPRPKLADRLYVTRPSVTAVVDGLVGRGLVERKHHDSDRRRIEHRLTEQGRQVLCRADRAVETRLREIAGHLADEEQGLAAFGGLDLWRAGAGDAHRAAGRSEGMELLPATWIAAGRRGAWWRRVRLALGSPDRRRGAV